MKNLIEIAQIVNKKRVKKIEIFDAHNLQHRDSKFNDFYLALQENKFRNDLEAAALLYDCDPSDSRYRQLKSRFRRRLLNTLFFLDANTPVAGNYEQAFYHSNREWTQIRILQSYGAEQSAIALARQLLTTALKYQFSDLVIGCTRLLCDQAAREGDEKDYQKYREQLDTYTGLLQAEIRSEQLYQQVLLEYRKDSPSEPGEYEGLIQAGEELLRLSEKYDSPTISFNMYFVWIMQFELNRDFIGALEVFEQADEYQQNARKEFYQAGVASRLFIRQMSAFLHLRQFADGRTAAERCLPRIPDGGPEWFKYLEYYLLLSLHTEQYVSAAAILSHVTTHKNYGRLSGLEADKWILYEGFVHFILSMEAERTQLLTKPKREPAAVSKMLDRPISEAKERRPLNFHIMLLGLMRQFNRKRQSGIKDQIELLYTFTISYLRKDYFFRHNQFVRLLHQLVKADLQPRMLSNTHKYESRLKERPFFYRGKLHELEFLPFEKLWALLCDRLE